MPLALDDWTLAWVLLRGTTRNEQKTLGLTLVAWGLMPIFALIRVDAPVKRVRWDLTDTWLWLALFAAMTGVGGWLVANTRLRGGRNVLVE